MKDLTGRVTSHKNISLHLNSQVAKVSGHIGKFTAIISGGNGNGKGTEISSGAIIVATGADRALTNEYGYGTSDTILTQTELEERLHENRFDGKNKNIVMIQCVGSRTSDHQYCSRVCCSMAVKNALKIKKSDPTANVFVLYRDIRTYGFREKYYQAARKAGVIFMRYLPEKPPVVSEENGLIVRLDSPDFPEPVSIETDTLVLSTGVAAPKDNRVLADLLKVPLNKDGFFVEAHLKLRPVDFANEGIFLCGLAHSPKMIDENISQARAAAARAATVLSKTQMEVNAQVSHVDQSKCISCTTFRY